jgi:ABC-2 type transport system ATP-binding protein
MSASVLQTERLGKRYRSRIALQDCTLDVPTGCVVGLVGPNGAGKSTLLDMICGYVRPTSGAIRVLGASPTSREQLARIGYVAQDTPVYSELTVEDHLHLGARLNPRWDAVLAGQRIRSVGLDPSQKAGRLSGGQRAQLALSMAAAKRPELLVFDEPVASLDPLARREFLQGLMELVSELDVSVILSSHLLSDLQRVCDYLVVLTSSRVQVAGDIDHILSTHHRVTSPRGGFEFPSDNDVVVVSSTHSARHSTLLVRTDDPTFRDLTGAEPLDLEEIVLAYMSTAAFGEASDETHRLPDMEATS